MDGPLGIDPAEHEELAAEPGDAARPEVERPDHEPTDELVGPVVGDLGARAQVADGGAEVDGELPRRAAGLRERFDVDDPADPQVERLEALDADLGLDGAGRGPGLGGHGRRGTQARVGSEKAREFAGSLTLTHNATSLILPTGANIQTSAGDCAVVVQQTQTGPILVAFLAGVETSDVRDHVAGREWLLTVPAKARFRVEAASGSSATRIGLLDTEGRELQIVVLRSDGARSLGPVPALGEHSERIRAEFAA